MRWCQLGMTGSCLTFLPLASLRQSRMHVLQAVDHFKTGNVNALLEMAYRAGALEHDAGSGSLGIRGA